MHLLDALYIAKTSNRIDRAKESLKLAFDLLMDSVGLFCDETHQDYLDVKKYLKNKGKMVTENTQTKEI